jgi:hypothetical protein
MSVYFITCRERGICKIGYAQNAKARRSSLQTASPTRLVLEATLPGSRELERKFHERFAEQRLSGEWFRITDELDALIRRAVPVHDTDAEIAPRPRSRQSDENLAERSIAEHRDILAAAMLDFEKLGPLIGAPLRPRRRFYHPVPASGGQFNDHYAIRGEGGHRHRLLCTDLGLSWDQADRLCDVLEEVRDHALAEPEGIAA